MKRAVAIGLLLVLVLSGAGVAVWQLAGDDSGSATAGRPASPGPTSVTPSPSGTAQKAPDPALQPFYDQELTWSDCKDGNQCATLEVPLDYADPGGERIELALLKNPAEKPDQRVGNLLVDPGGPGGSGTDYAAGADVAFRAPLRNAFDIIGFDPRGVTKSTAVDCLSDAEVDDYIAVDPVPDTAAEVKDYGAEVSRIGRGCARLSPQLSAHVSTVEAARDMDVIRGVLGDDTLTYLGASYGTELGATYAELFPAKTGRVVLDGAVDVSLDARQSALGQARGFQTALTAYVDDCLAGGNCFLGDTRQAALDRITAFLEQVDRQPLQVGKRELTVGNAIYGIILPLYDKQYWDSLLTPGLKAAFAGNGTTLLLLSDAYAHRNPDGTYQDNSVEAFYAISCLDDSFAIPASKVPAEYSAFEKASPTFGRVFAWGLTGCGGLQVPEAKKIKIDGSGAAPLLVIGTTRDPATPYAWAQALAAQLESAVLITRDGDGHTGYNQGNSCVDETVEDYLIDGKTPAGDKDCGS